MGKKAGVPRTAPAPVIEVPNRNRMHECHVCSKEVSRRQSVELLTDDGKKVRVCRAHDMPTISCIVTRMGQTLHIGSVIHHTNDEPVMSFMSKDGTKKTFRAMSKDSKWYVSKTKGIVCMCFIKIPESCIRFVVTRLANNLKSVFVEPVKEES